MYHLVGGGALGWGAVRSAVIFICFGGRIRRRFGLRRGIIIICGGGAAGASAIFSSAAASFSLASSSSSDFTSSMVTERVDTAR